MLDNLAVLDRETGLVWERFPDLINIAWTGAPWYCNSKKVGGRYGWRLPSIEQLISLIDDAETGARLPQGHPFKGIHYDPNNGYWTSTTYESKPSYAVLVQFTEAPLGMAFKEKGRNVWCVRGGQTP